MNGKKLAVLAITAVLSTTALHAVSAADERTVIHFADLQGIRNWQPGPDDSLLIEGRNNQWYRATFWGPCYDVKFHEAIAFVTEPTGELDKFSSVLVGGQRCWFRTFEKIDPP